MKDLFGFPVMLFIKDVLLKISIPTILAFISPTIIIYSMEPSLFRMFVTCLVSICIAGLCIFMIGLTKGERQFLISKIKGIIK